MRNKRAFIVFIFILSFLSFTHLLTFAQGAGYIQIQSDPGANVFLDDKIVGKIHIESGSLILKDIPAGSHQLKIVKEGYKVHTEIIEIRPNEIKFHSVVLKPRIGSLIIETEPVECTIEIPLLGIDEKNKGKKTIKTWELSSIPIGNYLINLTASNKRVSYSFEIEEEISKCLLVNILDNEVKEIKRVATYNWEKTYEGNANCIIQTTDGGYAVTGTFFSKGKYADVWILKLDRQGNIVWEKTYGGKYDDKAFSIIQTKDGGYALTGTTFTSNGLEDLWIIKLDSIGDIEWDKKFVGQNDDIAKCIIQTTDGGYAVVGYSKYPVSSRSSTWIIKLDILGNHMWTKTYGEKGFNEANWIIQTTDGGYAAVGKTTSKGAGERDGWIIKLDHKGDLVWEKTYGGSEYDSANSIIQTTDGCYAIAGWTRSKGAGERDAWIIKLDSNGNLIWEKTFGGGNNDDTNCIIQTTDGGYAVAGETWSKSAGKRDGWIIKLDSNGNLIWDKTYSGTGKAIATSIIQTTNGDYVVAGNADSKGFGYFDAWILKLDKYGNVVKVIIDMETKKEVKISEAKEIQPIISWDKTYGGDNYDEANWIIQTTDGGYAVAGLTCSKGTGGSEAWIFKIDSEGNIIWDKTYGGDNYDEANSIIQTTDGGYAVAGETMYKDASGYDVWIFKLDSEGNIIWDKTYSGPEYDNSFSIIQTTDGGYAIVGRTFSQAAGRYEARVIKMDSLGNMIWERTYSDDVSCYANTIIQTNDGNYLVAGGISTKGEYEEYINNVWIIKIDDQGEIIWEQRNGRNRIFEFVEATAIIQTTDDGYAVVGYTNQEKCGPTGESWIIKLDSHGNKIWDRTLTNTPNYAESIIQTIDGDLMVTGASFSQDIAESDTWLIKLDNYGNIVWEKTFGGGMSDGANSIIQTTDGGYALAGYTESKGAGYIDAWIIKLENDGNLLYDSEDHRTEKETKTAAPSYTYALKGSLHCPDKAGYVCPGCLDEPGYVNHFQGFNVLTEEEDCYVSLVTSDGSSMGDVNDCVVTITGEKWLGLEDEGGVLLVDVLNKGNFDFLPACKWSSKTMNFPRDGYQYQLAEGGKEFRLHLSRDLKESFQAVPWQNLSLELKNNKTGNIYTYQFSKGIFPRPYSWGNGVANYGQCVWWAAKRWVEKVGSNLFPFYPQRSNMGKVKPIDNNYTPEQYDILINYDPDKAHKLGHYAFIEKVEDTLIYISQFNFIPPGEVYNVIPRFWSGNPKSLYYSLNPHNEYYFKYYYRR